MTEGSREWGRSPSIDLVKQHQPTQRMRSKTHLAWHSRSERMHMGDSSAPMRELKEGDKYQPSPQSYDVASGVVLTHPQGPRATIGKMDRDLVKNEVSNWTLSIGPGPSEYRDIHRTNDDAHDLSIRTKRTNCSSMFGSSRSLQLTNYSSGGPDGQLGAETAQAGPHEPLMTLVKRQHSRAVFAKDPRPFLQESQPCAMSSAATIPSPQHYRPNLAASQPLPSGGRVGRSLSSLHPKSLLPVEAAACRSGGAYKAASVSSQSLYSNVSPNKYSTKLNVYKPRQPSHSMLGRHGTMIGGRDWLHSSCN